MNLTLRSSSAVTGNVSAQVLSQNIEVYENTIPAMLSDRLRNPKFAGPANAQTGVAAEWEPVGNNMAGLRCQLVPGDYLSGHEAQLIQHYAEHGWAGILQHGVQVYAGEELEVELWARARHRPVTVAVELQAPGQNPLARVELPVDVAHWTRRTARLQIPSADAKVYFKLLIPGDSLVTIDQVHLRPVGEPNVSRALLESFDHFPCPVLRFPGGCASCAYHWEHGIGPVHRRPVHDDPVFKYKLHYDFGTDEYLELCAARRIRPHITLNSTTATPDDAAAWAAYIRQWYIRRNLPVPAAYFAVGNENYGPWELGHMTGDMYVAQLREFVPAVRAAYPEARLMALGEATSTGLRAAHTTPWRATVLTHARDLFDILAVTRYTWVFDTGGLHEALTIIPNALAEKEADLRQLAQDAGPDKTIAVVEWNLWTRASHNDHAGFYEPNDIRHCLYGAGLLHVFCRLGNALEVANFYSLVNTMGLLHSRDGRVTLSDLVKLFNLYAPALPADVLEIECDHRRPVDALLLRAAGRTYAFLVNFSATEAVTVELTGLGPIRAATGLTGERILEPVREITPATRGAAVELPAASVVRVTF